MPDISASSTTVQIPATTASTSRTTSDAGRLGKQDFLKLLMAQLSNQDPLKPMDDTQMIAQMAQFSALEETQHLRQVMQHTSNLATIGQAGALIGKYVQAAQADGTVISGVVDTVNVQTTDGVVRPTLSVDGQIVDYSQIRTVSSSPSARPDPQGATRP